MLDSGDGYEANKLTAALPRNDYFETLDFNDDGGTSGPVILEGLGVYPPDLLRGGK
jgi:hypothetical protein